jgi:predicted enzyme related to lactoylglutathione lyase
VDGILHFCGDLHAKGVTFIAEPTKQDFGIMAMIADPDGNMMALWGGPLETE